MSGWRRKLKSFFVDGVGGAGAEYAVIGFGLD